MTDRNLNIVSAAFRLILGLVFLYAAVDKITDPFTFAADIRNYQIVPGSLSNLLAIFLPWLELICAFLLIAGLYTRSSAMFIALMLIVFLAAISLAMIRGLNIDCGCYHTLKDSSRVGYKKLIEDFLYFFMAIFLVFSKRTGPSLDNLINKS
jgi:putative oxidoreductase